MDRATLLSSSSSRLGKHDDVPVLIANVKAATDVNRVSELHRAALKTGNISCLCVANTLITAYAKLGELREARKMFEMLQQRSVASWNALMLGYAVNGQGGSTLELFENMDSHGCPPDGRSVLAALKACGSSKGLRIGKGFERVHLQAANHGLCDDAYIVCSLVHLYGELGCMRKARVVFDQMKCFSIACWNALMLGYAENGEGRTALDFFEECLHIADGQTFVAALKACSSLLSAGGMSSAECLEKGMCIQRAADSAGFGTNIFVENTLIDLYANCGSMDLARNVFDRMRRRNVVSWNALLFGYAENKKSEEALQLFTQMTKSQGVRSNARGFIAALKACGNLAALETGRSVHAEIMLRQDLEKDVQLVSSLVDFYGKCGSMSEAQLVFDAFPAHKLDRVAWSSLIAGYSRVGDTQRVFATFKRMQDAGVEADAIVYRCVLTACSRSGQLQKGMDIFRGMPVTARREHYHCIIDMLGRANELEAAASMARSMPFLPTEATWMLLLSSCNKWKNVAIARIAFEELMKLGCEDESAFLLMANVYGSANMLEERRSMLEALIKPCLR